MIETTYRNYTLYIGENAKENDTLVRQSTPSDIWAHISDYPSAHGIILNPSGKKVPNAILKRVCCIIKSKSNKCKSMNNLQFDICKISDVIPSDDTPGLVTITNAKNIVI
tara:strand:- start:1671 stop:2000 length:330 start_codon:yes stop_codon:yes gene_type:complete